MGQVNQNSTLYAGDVAKQAIYQIKNGEGFTWGNLVRTEVNVDAKPRQLTRAIHSDNPLQVNIKNPVGTDFAASGANTNIDGRQLSVVELIMLENFDVNDWKGTFLKYQPNGLSVDLKASPEINRVVRDLVFSACHTQMNALHSSGDVGGGDLYDGFVTKMVADSEALPVDAPTALNSGNVVARFRALKNSVEPRNYNKNLSIITSYAAANLFQDATADTQTSEVVTMVNGVMNMYLSSGKQIPIIPVEGIPNNFAFITPTGSGNDSNLVQGFWMDRDKDTLLLYKENPADQIHRLVFRICTGVEYFSGRDIRYITS